jgi:soluble lytic murein transglycosylase-like protein
LLGLSAAVLLAGVVAATASASVSPPTVRATSSADSVVGYVTEAARRFSIPESWIYAVMRIESAGDPRAVSPKGAAGLMQIMPDTWAYLRARYGLGGDMYDPRDNIMAGAAFLRELYDRYGAPGFLAAYNAGPGRYENHLATGRPLPAETIAYVSRLAPVVGGTVPDRAPVAAVDPYAWTRAALFAGRPGSSIDRAEDAVEPPSETPPVARRPRDIVSPASVSAGLFVPLSGTISR